MLRNEAFFLLRALGQEDPLEDGVATHTSNFSWGIPWTEKACQAAIHGHARVRQEIEVTQHTKSRTR